MPVLLNNIQEKRKLTEEQFTLVEAVLKFGLERHQQENAEVSLVLVDDDYIRELNLEYRGLDQPTDVLSFAFHEAEANIILSPDEDIPDLLGDIYISVERAYEQSERFGHSFERELCYLAIHGLLHLMGYDHQTPEDTAKMREAEEQIMEQFALGRAGF